MRLANPQTYEQIRNSKALSPKQWEVYDLLYREGPLAGPELNHRTGSTSAHKRLSELRKMGVVLVRGTAWDVTDRLPERTALRRAPLVVDKPSSVEMNLAVDDLRELWTIAVSAGYQPSPALKRVGEWLASGAS